MSVYRQYSDRTLSRLGVVSTSKHDLDFAPMSPFMNFCHYLRDNTYEWPSNQPLSFDGSSFNDDYPDESVRVFLSAALRSYKGKTMILRNLTLSPQSRNDLKKVLQSNSDIQSLTLYNISSSNTSVDDDDNDGLASTSSCSSDGLNCDFLVSSGESMIQDLTIDRCRLDLQTATVLRDGLFAYKKNLKHLKLSNMNLSMDCMIIADGIANTAELESLELNRVRMDSCVFSRLIQALTGGSSPPLKKLRLDGCGLDNEHVSGLAELVAHLEYLTELNLGGNDLDSNCLDILIRDGLSSHRSLTHLVLDSNPIGDEGAIHLSNYLTSSQSKLQSLSIVDCDIWSSGCRVLAERLLHFVSLKTFIVDGEWDDHLEAISTSMKSNMVLTSFWIPSYPILLLQGNPHVIQINYYLILNRGRRRALIEPHLLLGLWSHILDSTTRRTNQRSATESVYHLLRHQPGVIQSSTYPAQHEDVLMDT